MPRQHVINDPYYVMAYLRAAVFRIGLLNTHAPVNGYLNAGNEVVILRPMIHRTLTLTHAGPDGQLPLPGDFPRSQAYAHDITGLELDLESGVVTVLGDNNQTLMTLKPASCTRKAAGEKLSWVINAAPSSAYVVTRPRATRFSRLRTLLGR